MSGARRRIGVIGLGGTIAMEGSDPLDTVEYAETVKHLEIADLLSLTPGLGRVADVIGIPFRHLKSHVETPETWLELAAASTLALTDGVDGRPIDGLVVTHGTITMEEAAYFLHLTVASHAPIVMVGSQRPRTALSSDSGMNLLRGVQVAASPEAVGAGVLVVFNDEIFGARHVTKSSNHRLDAYKAPGGLGPLGYAEADLSVSMYRRETRRHTLDSRFAHSGPRPGDPLARVDILASYGGADGVPVDACVAAGARGIVVSSLPPGLTPPPQEQALSAARRAGVEVIIASRTGGSRVLKRQRYLDAGFVVADNMSPQAARLLAVLAISAPGGTDDLQTAFDEY
jgi:L-asparaginase